MGLDDQGIRAGPDNGASDSNRGLLKAVTETMAEGVAVFDMSGGPVLVNDALDRMAGDAAPTDLMRGISEYQKSNELRTEEGDLIPVEEWAVPRILRGETVVDWRVQVRHLDTGVETHISISGRPVYDSTGRQEMALIIIRDLTDLKRSEEKYRQILESIDDGFCIFRMIFDGRGEPIDYLFLEANPAFERHTGLHDVLGRTIRELVPDLDSSWFRLYGKVALSGQPIRFENYDPAMGRWFDVHASRTGKASERKVAVLFKDVSARKRTAEALIASEARATESERFMRHILDNLFTFVGLLETDGTFLEANRAPMEAGGVTLEEVRGKKFWDTYWWNYDDAVSLKNRDACRRAASGEVVRYDAVIRLAGDVRSVIDFQIAPLRDESGRITHLIPSAVDITERSRLERERNKFALLVEASNDFIAITDFEGACSFLNAGGRILLGLGGDSGEGKKITDMLFDGEQQGFQSAKESARTGSRWQGEFRFRNARTGEPVPAWTNIFPLRSPETGDPFALALVARDLTLVREKEAQLRQAQRVEAIGRLAGGVAHDFNNLLTAINGYSDMLLDSFSKDDPRTEFIKEIRTSGQRAASLTSQLLAYSRKQVLQPKLMQLNDLVRESTPLLRRVVGENIEVQLRLAPDLLAIKADPNQIHQILINLCLNARDAMPSGGRLVIATRNAALPEDVAALRAVSATAAYTLLEISDTGSGMERELMDRIFEPFFTTKGVGKGTGLGLSSVEGIVKQSGGQILVESEVQRGTTFKVFLPGLAGAESAKETEHPVSDARANLGRGTILLVEDEGAVRKFVKNLMENEGYTVLEAKDGLDAQILLETTDARPELLLSDIIMPRMGGLQLASYVRKQRPEIHILLMSGYTEDAFNRQVEMEESLQIIQKPFSSQTLIKKIREALQDLVPGN